MPVGAGTKEAPHAAESTGIDTHVPIPFGVIEGRAIAISGLVKTFGAVRALDGLDMSVAAGEKPNMVIAGKNAAKQATQAEVAEKTMRVMRPCVPAAVPRWGHGR
jgi:hypothetical protein